MCASTSVSGVGSKNGASSASGTQPTSIIQPVTVFCGIGGFHLRSSTVPIAHDSAAPRIIAAANGELPIVRNSSPSSSAIPAVPSTRPTILRVDSGSSSTNAPIAVAQIGIVYARMALRPAAICWTPNSRRPFQPAMLKNASVDTRSHHARGTHTPSPAGCATAKRPSAANGSVNARNVSGGSSLTPILRIGQLRPQTIARTPTGSAARHLDRAGEAGPFIREWPVAASSRRTSRAQGRAGGSPYLLWCSERACVTHSSRRIRPGNSWSLASNSSMSRSDQNATWRNVVTPS